MTTEHTSVDTAIQVRRARLDRDSELVRPRLRDWWVRYFHTHERHFRQVLSLLPPPAPAAGASVLEVGSVPGHLTVLLQDLGYSVVGVDIDPARIEPYAEANGCTLTALDVERQVLPFADDSFDAVVFTEILEHLRWNPIFALKEAARVLASGGRFVLSIPQITPYHRLRFLFGRDYQGDPVAEFAKLEWAGHMGHFRFYSENELTRMMTHAGLSGLSFVPGGKAQPALARFFGPFRGAFLDKLYVRATKA